MVLTPGSQPSQKTNSAVRNTAEANSGIEVVTTANTETRRSSDRALAHSSDYTHQEPRRHDDQQRGAGEQAGCCQSGHNQGQHVLSVVG